MLHSGVLYISGLRWAPPNLAGPGVSNPAPHSLDGPAMPVYNSSYDSNCIFVFLYYGLLLPFAIMYFSALMDSVILHLRTVLLLFCCAVCTALLFSYSAIFIAASVRNEFIVIVIDRVSIGLYTI